VAVLQRAPVRGPAPVERAPGQVIAGRFRLVQKLGEGGMGSVWVAQHVTLKVHVAIKFMDTAFASGDETSLKRFHQEATAAAAIQSPYVVKILDYGNDTAGRPYLAMELLRGEDLDHRLERGGPLPLEVVQQIVTESCRGLAAAHAEGVVHRDLKPENIFLCKEAEGFSAKILDFGIARATHELATRGNLTLTGQLLGTPMYMSPEQALGRKDVDFRSDLYSLGVVAFQALTAVTPYEESETVGEIIVSITTKAPRDAALLRPELPGTVVRWLEKCLAKKPEDRFGSAKEMADALNDACAARKMTITMSGFDVDDTVPPNIDFDSLNMASVLEQLTPARISKRDPARQAVTQRDVEPLRAAPAPSHHESKPKGASPTFIFVSLVVAALIVGSALYFYLRTH
jgi:serine/threonine-protein kinase